MNQQPTAPVKFDSYDKEYLTLVRKFDISEMDCADNQLWVLRTYWSIEHNQWIHSLISVIKYGRYREEGFVALENGEKKSLWIQEYNSLTEMF